MILALNGGHFHPIQWSRRYIQGAKMSNLKAALQELREERKRAQAQVESLDQAISVIESLNGFGTLQKSNQPPRTISQASRRKMALAQQARWAKVRHQTKPVGAAGTEHSEPAKRTMSPAARRKIAAAQRARWAKVKNLQKKAA
jgi:hypothetical protein